MSALHQHSAGPPNIHNAEFDTIMVKVGESFEFQRFVKAEPPATVLWKVDGRPIQSGKRVKITYRKNDAGIEISKCELKDSGVYSIRAVNEYGEDVQKLFRLVVSGPPKIYDTELKKISVTNGETLEFDIFVDAEPKATVSWKLNDQPIENRAGVITTVEKGYARIKVYKCDSQYEGIYSIRAKNSYGQMEQKVFRLEIKPTTLEIILIVAVVLLLFAGIGLKNTDER